ncbi:MAG: hypothetical protein R6V85_14320 [Polyangia bacterium]
MVYYDLPGLSFREYLAFRHGIELPVLALREILENHVDIGADDRIPLYLFGFLY